MQPPPCPRCAQPLHVKERGTLALGPCFGCGGLWLSTDASKTIEAALSGDANDAALFVRERAATPYPEQQRGGASLRCPTCESVMQRWPVGSVEVDHCPAHGTWYDRGELARVQDELGRRLAVDGTPVLGTSAAVPTDGPLELAREPTRGAKRNQGVSGNTQLWNVLRAMNAVEDARRRRASDPQSYYSRQMHRSGVVGAAESFIYGDDWGWT